jgi:hypothetical protein
MMMTMLLLLMLMTMMMLLLLLVLQLCLVVALLVVVAVHVVTCEIVAVPFSPVSPPPLPLLSGLDLGLRSEEVVAHVREAMSVAYWY